MKTITTDVAVIGSGFGGSVVARRLQEAGHQVTVLEKGPRIDPYADFQQTQDPKTVLKYIHNVNSEGLALTYAEALGGGSGFYEMASIRTPHQVFNWRDPDTGERVWPRSISRDVMDPYYDIAEKAVNAAIVDWERLPRSGAVLAQLLDQAGFTATRVKHAERGCIGSGYCITGCVYGAKQSMLVTHLPAAEEAGATIITDVDVRHLRPSDHHPYRYDVICVDRTNNSRLVVRAKTVVLGAGVVGSAAVLLRSRKNLPHLSAQVGRNVASNGMVQAIGLIPESAPHIDMYAGRSHSGVVCYDYLETENITISSCNALPLYMYSGARITEDRNDAPYWGPHHLALVKRIKAHGLVLYSLGMFPGIGSIRIDTDGSPIVDQGDLAVYDAYQDRVKTVLHDLYRRMKCTPLRVTPLDGEGRPYKRSHVNTTHMTGSCRMADSDRHGVCNSRGEVFHYPGIFVADSSALPTSLAVNPSLTIMANAERIVPSILEYLS